MEGTSNGEEPTSWEELYKVNLMPSEIFLKFRKEFQSLRVGLNLELYNAPLNDYHAKLVLKPLANNQKWKFIYEPLCHDVQLVSRKIPLTKFLFLQVGIGHSFHLNATGWKWKLGTRLGGDGASRVQNKTSVALCPGVGCRFGWRADYVLPEITGGVGTDESLFNMKSGRLVLSLDSFEQAQHSREIPLKAQSGIRLTTTMWSLSMISPNHRPDSVREAGNLLRMTPCWRMIRMSSTKPSSGMLFAAREARLEGEYWKAAWLRAESDFENREHDRYAGSYLRKFAEQEFNAMKTRYKAQSGGKSRCVIAEGFDSVIVGTLDLLPAEAFQHMEPSSFDQQQQVGNQSYIANLCVAKSARRKGVATAMLEFAIARCKAEGAEKVFVHVHGNNDPAKGLYQKMGFQVVDKTASRNASDAIHFMCLELLAENI